MVFLPTTRTHWWQHGFVSMSIKLTGATAVLISETNATSYFQGGTFQLGNGPFTDLSFSASDDDTDFVSFGAQFGESSGPGRQLGELTDGSGSTFEQGLVSLEDVLTLSDPSTGDQFTVGRVTLRVDNGQPGGGPILQNFYIFSAPVNPTVSYNVISIEYTVGATPDGTYQYNSFNNSAVVCFADGTEIVTDRGPVPVEFITSDMRVQTLDQGMREVLWAGGQSAASGSKFIDGALLPVRIAPGAFGNEKPLYVSQQHRILVGDKFVKAKHLVTVPGFPARLARGKRNLRYFHILLEDHSVLIANGVCAESLYLGPVSNVLLQSGKMGPDPASGLKHMKLAQGGLARPMVKRHLVDDHVQLHLSKKATAA